MTRRRWIWEAEGYEAPKLPDIRWRVTIWGWSTVDAAFGGSGKFIVEQSFHRWKWQADLRQFMVLTSPWLLGLVWAEVEPVTWPKSSKKQKND